MPSPIVHETDVRLLMAWLNDSLILNKATPQSVPLKPSDDPNYFGTGSPNMKLLFAGGLWISAPTNVNRQRLLSILSRERLAHGQQEPLSASHGQLWLGGIGAIALAAYRRKDNEILTLCISWLQAEYLIYKCCQMHDGNPWLPGGRGFLDKKISGGNPARLKMIQAIEKGKPDGHPNQYDVGGWAIAGLPIGIRQTISSTYDNALRSGFPIPLRPMWGPYTAKRFSDGDFYSYYERLDYAMEPVLSAGVLDGQPWISAGKDQEKIEETENRHKGSGPVLELRAPGARVDAKTGRLVEG